jgi:hypothetical protein
MKLLTVPSSGSQAGITNSRNRFGQYVRSRAIPVNPNTVAQGNARARMSASSQAWKALTNSQRAAWSDLGASMSRKDSLGQTYTLQGNQAYASINNMRNLCGLAPIADPPAVSAPVGLATVTPTISTSAFSIAYTATPLGAATYLALFASPQRSAGRSYESDYRFIKLSTAAQASPLVATSEYTAKFGIPVIGNKIFVSLVPITLGFAVILLVALLKRLVVPRTELSQSVPTTELVVNRLFFDRDIRDRKAWMSQSHPTASSKEQPHGQDEPEKR